MITSISFLSLSPPTFLCQYLQRPERGWGVIQMGDVSHGQLLVPEQGISVRLYLDELFYCSLFMLFLSLSRMSICLDTCKPKLTTCASLLLDPFAKPNRQNQTSACGISGQNRLFWSQPLSMEGAVTPKASHCGTEEHDQELRQ